MALVGHVHRLSQIFSFPYLDILWVRYCFPRATFFRPSQTELNTKAQGPQIIQAILVFGGNTIKVQFTREENTGCVSQEILLQ